MRADAFTRHEARRHARTKPTAPPLTNIETIAVIRQQRPSERAWAGNVTALLIIVALLFPIRWLAAWLAGA